MADEIPTTARSDDALPPYPWREPVSPRSPMSKKVTCEHGVDLWHWCKECCSHG